MQLRKISKNLNKRTMDTGIRDFCVKYKEKLKNDKEIKRNILR